MLSHTDLDFNFLEKYHVNSSEVHSELKKHMLIDGFDLVLDLKNSSEEYFYDKLSGRKFNDFFSCFASMPLRMNNPKLKDKKFLKHLGESSVNKVSNSDIYTEEMATFVKTFFKVAVPEYFKYSFFIDGGALAVENALKASFDWKTKKNLQKGIKVNYGSQIIHFEHAFHGRSGYTLSLTNTDPNKTNYYPIFNWPRVVNPKLFFPINENNLELTIETEKESIRQIKSAIHNNRNEIAAIIIEPIQCEGGDNHFRNEFLLELRLIADENDVLLIFDEVQTGVGITGTMWAHEQMDVIPDILSFGKKTQVCGILATNRIDEVPNNVFHESGRINSTWGGNITDMVRATRIFEVIEEDNLVINSLKNGQLLKMKIEEFQNNFPDIISNGRGKGSLRAFDLPDTKTRDEFKLKCYDNGLLILGCGEKSIRFRPTLDASIIKIEEGCKIINDVLMTI